MADDRITVGGFVQRKLEPEFAEWTLTIVSTAEDARVAFDRCAERTSVVVEGLRATAKVTTDWASVEPTFDYRDGAEVQTGHRAEARVVARASISEAGEVADAAMASGADQLRGPRFVMRGAEAAEIDALADALAHARRRADALAEAAGRSVGRVLSIRTEVSRDASPRFFTGGFEEMSGAMPVEAPELTVATGVIVEFSLED